jgi:hypothetical protein
VNYIKKLLSTYIEKRYQKICLLCVIGNKEHLNVVTDWCKFNGISYRDEYNFISRNGFQIDRYTRQ